MDILGQPTLDHRELADSASLGALTRSLEALIEGVNEASETSRMIERHAKGVWRVGSIDTARASLVDVEVAMGRVLWDHFGEFRARRKAVEASLQAIDDLAREVGLGLSAAIEDYRDALDREERRRRSSCRRA